MWEKECGRGRWEEGWRLAECGTRSSAEPEEGGQTEGGTKGDRNRKKLEVLEQREGSRASEAGGARRGRNMGTGGNEGCS